jgi:hypothetical protein
VQQPRRLARRPRELPGPDGAPGDDLNLASRDVVVRIMGDVAIVHARTTYTLPGGRAGMGRYTDVWARPQGRWLAVSAHVTRG